jgi:hypothetical protein
MTNTLARPHSSLSNHRKAALRLTVLVTLAIIVGWPQPAHAGNTQKAAHPIVFTQLPTRRDPGQPPIGYPAAASPLPDGSRLVLLETTGDGDPTLVNLAPQFAAAGRPDVSYDGKRILFVGRRNKEDVTSVFEVGIDGSNLREVVTPPGQCVTAIYLSTIYTMDMERPDEQIAVSTIMNGVPAICTCRSNGSRLRRITFTPDGAWDPVVLNSGRILYASRKAPDPETAGGQPRAELFTVNADGTDVFIFQNPSEAGKALGMASELPDRTVVYVESEDAGSLAGGRLLAARPGPELRRARAEQFPTARGGALSSHDAGEYRTPAPTPDGRLLVSHRDGGTYGIYMLDPLTDMQQEIYDATEWHELDPKVVAARRKPAGRSSFVKDQETAGEMFCLDAYLNGLERDPDKGEQRIDRVRVYQSELRASEKTMPKGNDPPDERPATLRQKLLGEAPVATDGSFYLRVPARTPLRLETVDASGDVLRKMQSWIWVMPNEARGCIGCHEDRELTPPNRNARALRDGPVCLGVAPKPRGESD